jgi:Bacterial regulatory helix-turn-helix protein, lysR family
MLTLRQIEAIRAIMVTGSVDGAARLLNVSSPGISRVMKHAEGQTAYPKRWLRQGQRSVICHFANQARRQYRTQIWIGAKHRECHGALIGVDPNDPYGRIMAGIFADHVAIEPRGAICRRIAEPDGGGGAAAGGRNK